MLNTGTKPLLGELIRGWNPNNPAWQSVDGLIQASLCIRVRRSHAQVSHHTEPLAVLLQAIELTHLIRAFSHSC